MAKIKAKGAWETARIVVAPKVPGVVNPNYIVVATNDGRILWRPQAANTSFTLQPHYRGGMRHLGTIRRPDLIRLMDQAGYELVS